MEGNHVGYMLLATSVALMASFIVWGTNCSQLEALLFDSNILCALIVVILICFNILVLRKW